VRNAVLLTGKRYTVRAALKLLHDTCGLSDEDIGVLLLTRRETVNNIRHGRYSGRNIAGRVALLMRTLDEIERTAKRPAR
jgi:hypothetical protein